MRRLPLVASFLLFVLLCASVAYWAMQLFKPPLRPVAAPPRTVQPEIRPQAAAALFGARSRPAAAASNYQLRGVIYSGSPRDSVAIISTDGKPAQSFRVDAEIVPGVTVTEVHRSYVMISENGASKRIELPEDAPALGGVSSANVNPALPPVTRTPVPAPSIPTPTRAQTAASGGQVAPIGPQGGAPQPPENQPAPMANTTAPPPNVGTAAPQTPATEGMAPPPQPPVNPAQQ